MRLAIAVFALCACAALGALPELDEELYAMVRKKDLMGATALLRRGANYSAVNSVGYTPLHVAAEVDASRVAEMLLVHGASPTAVNSQESGQTPLHVAAQRGHFATLRILLQREGIKAIDFAGDTQRGKTPLQLAAWKGHVHISQLLLENGANSSIVTERSGSALHLAAYHGHRTVVENLLRYGAYVNIVDRGGMTPLDHAMWRCHEDVFVLLAKEWAADGTFLAPPASTSRKAAKQMQVPFSTVKVGVNHVEPAAKISGLLVSKGPTRKVKTVQRVFLTRFVPRVSLCSDSALEGYMSSRTTGGPRWPKPPPLYCVLTRIIPEAADRGCPAVARAAAVVAAGLAAGANTGIDALVPAVLPMQWPSLEPQSVGEAVNATARSEAAKVRLSVDDAPSDGPKLAEPSDKLRPVRKIRPWLMRLSADQAEVVTEFLHSVCDVESALCEDPDWTASDMAAVGVAAAAVAVALVSMFVCEFGSARGAKVHYN